MENMFSLFYSYTWVGSCLWPPCPVQIAHAEHCIRTVPFLRLEFSFLICQRTGLALVISKDLPARKCIFWRMSPWLDSSSWDLRKT